MNSVALVLVHENEILQTTAVKVKRLAHDEIVAAQEMAPLISNANHHDDSPDFLNRSRKRSS